MIATKMNLALPTPICDAFNEAAQRYGYRRKYAAYSAAMLLFLEISPDSQDKLVRNIINAELPGGTTFEELLTKSTSKAMRRSAEAVPA